MKEFTRIRFRRRIDIPRWNEAHTLEHVAANKEVVVNAPTLICQEFCRTRTHGEKREGTTGGATLSYGPVRTARRYHYTATRMYVQVYIPAVHLYALAGQRVSNGFSRGSTSCQNCLIVSLGRELTLTHEFVRGTGARNCSAWVWYSFKGRRESGIFCKRRGSFVFNREIIITKKSLCFTKKSCIVCEKWLNSNSRETHEWGDWNFATGSYYW